VTDIADRLQELAEGAAREVRAPGADLARRRGRRRRRRLVAGVAVAAVLAVGLVQQGRLADWSAPAPPVAPDEEIEWPTPVPRRLTGVVEVGRGQLPAGGSWRLDAGIYDRPSNPDGKRELSATLTVAFPGRDKISTMAGVFEEPVQLGMDASLIDPWSPELPVRPVYGAVSRRTARVEVIPRQGPAVLSPLPARLLDGGARLPARFWVAFLPSGGAPPQAVHQVRSYDADGRELCRLDPDNLTPSCRG
jgi:hypothetical protein